MPIKKVWDKFLCDSTRAQQLFGYIVLSRAAITHAKLKVRSLPAWFLSNLNNTRYSNWKTFCVTLEVADQLHWWPDTQTLSRGWLFEQTRPSILLTRDAHLTGWSTHYKGRQIHALWSQEENKLHANMLGMLAAIKAFKAFELLFQGKVVRLAKDNTRTMFYVNKHGHAYSLCLVLFCPLGMVYSETYLPHVVGEDNHWEDSLSHQLHRWASGNYPLGCSK